MLITIVLSEVIAVLIGIVLFFIIKHRKKKISPSLLPIPSKKNNEETISYLEKLAKITTSRLSDLNIKIENTKKISLTKRLDFIAAEINILKTHDLNSDDRAYWDMVDKAYLKNKKVDNNDVKTPSKKEEIYLARIDNLEAFRALFYDTEKRLIKSNITIQELRHLIEEKPSPDINKLFEKITAIENENNDLCKKIQQSENELAKTIAELENTEEPSELDALKEENEFLVIQIQHLLQQEVVASKSMLENLHSLEDALEKKNDECKKLTALLAQHKT